MGIQSVSPDRSSVEAMLGAVVARYSLLYGCLACGTVAGRTSDRTGMSDEEHAFADRHLVEPDVPQGYREADALADYLWRYCRKSFCEADRRIDGTMINRWKFDSHRSMCPECQKRGICDEERDGYRWCRYGDQEIEQEMRDGWRAFQVRSARRLSERNPQLSINRCSVCGAVCRTPEARQCRRCGHDWHLSLV